MKFGIGFALGLIAGLLIGGFFYLSKPNAQAATATPDPLERKIRYQVSGLTETGTRIDLALDVNGDKKTADSLPYELIEKARAGDSVSIMVLNQSPDKSKFGFLGCKILSNGVEIAFEMDTNARELVLCDGVVR